MASTTLHLVRHGHANHDEDDPGLTESGRRQAEATAASMTRTDFTECYHSPKRRAAETAAVIGAVIGCDIETNALADDLTPIPEDWSDVPVRYVRSVLDAPWWRWIGLNQDSGAVTVVRFETDLGARLVAFNRNAS